MSHFTRVKTRIRNQGALLKALQDMGFTAEQVQVHKEAIHLHGYTGDKRQQTAEIVIPRRFVGGAANDIGFKLQEDGTYEAIISEYDRRNHSADKKSQHAQGCGGYSEKWLKKLNQRYAYGNIKQELSDGGFFIESEHEENGEIFLSVGSHLFSG